MSRKHEKTSVLWCVSPFLGNAHASRSSCGGGGAGGGGATAAGGGGGGSGWWRWQWRPLRPWR